MISRGLIEYPSPRNTHYNGEDKVLPNRSQEENSGAPNPIGLRILEAMKPRNQKEIAAALSVAGSSVNEWLKTGKVSKKNLEKVSEISGRSVGWLLTGKAEPNEAARPAQENEARIDLGDSDLIFIHKLAETEGKDFEQMVYALVVEALKARGSQLFADYHKIPAKELDDLLGYVLPRKRGSNNKHKGGSV